MTDPAISPPPTRRLPPPEVRSLAHARREARLARDWSEADRLKAEIESAGWRVVDRGVDFALVPAAPPDILVGDVTWHGSSASVPSVLDAAPDVRASIVVTVAGLVRADGRIAPPHDQFVVVVAQGDSDAAANAPGGEIVRLKGDPTPGARLAAGLRRTRGEMVIVVDDEAVPEPAAVEKLIDALDDPSVACAGASGAMTGDLRTFAPVETGDADVLLPGIVAFRRRDAIAALPVDERYVSAARTIEWWSLRLRDLDEAVVRRAVVVPGLASTAAARALAATEDRASKRDFYRLIDAFGRRPDLLSGLG